jgi:hypothetical protein
VLFAFIYLGGTFSGDSGDDSVLRIAPCRLEVILNHTRVCLDGDWVLSNGILGKEAVYRFVRERGYLLLVPQLDSSSREALRKRLDARVLETESLETALSIQGMVLHNGLVFDQRNVLVSWHETSRINFIWNGKFFIGQSTRISKNSQSGKPEGVTLRRYRAGDLDQSASSQADQEDF